MTAFEEQLLRNNMNVVRKHNTSLIRPFNLPHNLK